jgi:hypothetical protein
MDDLERELKLRESTYPQIEENQLAAACYIPHEAGPVPVCRDCKAVELSVISRSNNFLPTCP